MRYRVTIQYTKGPEDPIAEFKNQQDAEIFIMTKINNDAALKIRVLYRLYESFDLVKEYDSAESAGTEGGQSSGGKSSGFRPTPLNTSPTPAGLPKKWWHDEDEDEKKK